MPDSRLPETTPNLEHMRLAVRLRRHFGEKWHGEPSMTFHADGRVQVRIGEHSVTLTREEARDIADAA